MKEFSNYSSIQLHSLFSSKTWNKLSFEDKVGACQEVENRYALSNGVAPCTIQTAKMQGGTYGYQIGNTTFIFNKKSNKRQRWQINFHII